MPRPGCATPPARPVYAGTLNIEGRSVSVPASAFSNNVYTLDERHFMHALTLEGEALGLDWRAIGSLYDFDRDVQRTPSGALPAAADGGAGSIVRLDGTGWRTFDLDARRHGGDSAAHDLSFGLHGDRFELASNRYATSDWRHGDAGRADPGARAATRGPWRVWAQDRWTPRPRLRADARRRATNGGAPMTASISRPRRRCR